MSEEKPKMGRPTKYNDEVPNKMREYFNVPLDKVIEEEVATNSGVKIVRKTVPNRMPTMEGFCVLMKIHKDTLYEWRKIHPELSDAFRECREIQKQFMVNHGLEGTYNASFTKFLLQNMSDYKDKIHNEIEQTTVQINIDKDDSEL